MLHDNADYRVPWLSEVRTGFVVSMAATINVLNIPDSGLTRKEYKPYLQRSKQGRALFDRRPIRIEQLCSSNKLARLCMENLLH